VAIPCASTCAAPPAAPTLHPFSDGQAVELASVALTLTADALFADLEGEGEEMPK